MGGSHNALCPALENLPIKLSSLKNKLVLHLLPIAHSHRMLKGRDKIQPNCVQGCYQSHVFPNSRLSLFPSVNVLCIDLIRAPTLQWGSITGGVLSPEENWCSLTKEKWIFKLIVSWEPRIQIHVSSGLSLYSLKGANQNYLT